MNQLKNIIVGLVSQLNAITYSSLPKNGYIYPHLMGNKWNIHAIESSLIVQTFWHKLLSMTTHRYLLTEFVCAAYVYCVCVCVHIPYM